MLPEMPGGVALRAVSASKATLSPAQPEADEGCSVAWTLSPRRL